MEESRLISAEYTALIIAVIVLIFDIIWQFLIAGVYAPKKARDLIISDPLIVTLQSEIKKLDFIDQKMIAQFKVLLAKLEGFNGLVTVLSNRVTESVPELKAYISGKMGYETAEINKKMDAIVQGDVGEQFEKAFSEGDLKTMEKMQERDMRYHTSYALISQYVKPETAEALSGLYATSKPGIRNAITKRIKKYVSGE